MTLDPAGFEAEAERFAARHSLELTTAEVTRLPPLTDDADRIGAGCFVGEALRRELGGHWRDDGTLVDLGHVAETAPLAKAKAGEDLAAYVADVLRYAH